MLMQHLTHTLVLQGFQPLWNIFTMFTYYMESETSNTLHIKETEVLKTVPDI